MDSPTPTKGCECEPVVNCGQSAHVHPTGTPCAAYRHTMGIPWTSTPQAVHTDSPWCAHEHPIKNLNYCPWASHGQPELTIGIPWVFHGRGLPVGRPRASRGQPVGSPWAIRGMSTGWPWDTGGQSTERPRTAHELPMRCLWHAHTMLIDLLCTVHGVPRTCPWIVHR